MCGGRRPLSGTEETDRTRGLAMQLTVQGKQNKTTTLEFKNGPEKTTVGDLKAAYAKATKMSVHRLSFKKDGNRLDNDSKTLDIYEVKPNDSLEMKDLGPQIGYRTVFVVEYLGPMLFVLFYALRPSFIYGSEASTVPYKRAALVGVVCWVAHFLKREFETFFVHKFSRPTMPLNNLFKNCAYYWSFGAVIGYPLCHPDFVSPSSTAVHIGFAIFLLSEIGNLICHVMLRNLRPSGSERPVPSGFLFNYVSCPNYTFEVLSWVGFSIMTHIPFSYLFTVIGFLQMTDWALKKHKGYIQTYGDEYKKLRRKAIVPFVL